MGIFDYIGISFFTSLFTSVIAYFVQRKHKISDAFKTEKDKKIVARTFDVEVKLFEIVNNAFSQFSSSSQTYIDYANEINTLRSENIIFITKSINKLCKDIADYLLLIAVNQSKTNKFQEQEFIKKFKKKFRK